MGIIKICKNCGVKYFHASKSVRCGKCRYHEHWKINPLKEKENERKTKYRNIS